MKNYNATFKPVHIGKFLFLLILSIFTSSSSAQLDSILHESDPGYAANLIAEDFEGNILVAGNSFIGKYNPTTSTWIWTTTVIPAEGSTGSSFNLDMVVDGSGSTFITGRYSGSMAFGTNVMTSTGNTDDIFVTKIDPDGIFLWAKSFGSSTGKDRSNSITLDGSGNIYIAGSYCNKVCSGPNPGGLEIADIYISKLNNSGNLLWLKRFAASKLTCGNGGAGYDVAVDGSGNVFATGFFEGTFKFGNTAALTLTSLGMGDVFTLKLNNSGTPQWAKAGRSSAVDRGISLYLDAAGNILVGGYYGDSGAGNINFAPATLNDVDGNGAGSLGTVSNAFLVQYTSSGNVAWAINPSPIAGIHNEVKSIIADPASSIRVAMPSLGIKSFSSLGIETSSIPIVDNFTTVNGLPTEKSLIRDMESSASGFISSIRSHCGTVSIDNLILNNLHCTDCANWFGCQVQSHGDNFIIRSSIGGGGFDSPSISNRSSNENLDFDLFPNPATDELQIRIPSNASGVTIRLTDQLGRNLLTQEMKGGQTNISIQLYAHLPNGIYFIQVEGHGKIQARRFMISR